MIKKISSKGKVFAYILDLSDTPVGTESPTDPTGSLQVLMRHMKKGHVVGKHTHKRIPKTTKQLNEGLVVIAGELRTRIFDTEGKAIGAARTVSAGQCLLFVDGGHTVEITKNARIFEFKNGPYVDDKIVL